MNEMTEKGANALKNGLTVTANDAAELLGSLSLLYVEDDPDIRAELTQFLTRRVGTLHVAANGREGLDAWRLHQPDVVVTDIMMPVMDGLEMSDMIKRDNPSMPIILATAFNETAYFLKAIQLGIDGYVLKPVSLSALQKKLGEIAQMLYQRRELAQKNAQMEALLGELQHYYDAVERENQIVASLMDRTIRKENLIDPLLHSWCAPATTFSGDLVAAQRAPNGDLYLILADATGHGLASAINLLPLTRIFYQMAKKSFSLSALLGEMNRAIREQSTSDRFVAATLVRVDVKNHILEVWNGGNPPAVWLNGNGEMLHLFVSTNLALGIVDSDMLDVHTEVIQWDNSAQLILFSDGFVEAENAVGEQIGFDALLATVAGAPHEERFSAMIQVVQDHLDGRQPHDDMSLVLVECPVE
ncbi:MAG: SpoIIE family protein phosphatase [Betaproteobacteria bacterium]|nr:SpoIIE family protein phosphatase [Betaproteobacteria bacterium]